MMSRSDKAKELEAQLEKEEKKEKKQRKIKIFLKVFLIIIGIFLLFILYMHFIGTKGLTVREYKIESASLPESFHGFKIVQFSDLHYLTTIHQKELDNMVDKINQLKPDIVVFTGDLIDYTKEPSETDINDLITSLNRIEVTTGLYAIKGNHDYEKDYFEKIFNETNFKILNNTYELIYYKGNTPILLTGLGSILQNDSDMDQAFSYDQEDNLYTITLLHEPDVIDDIVSKYSVDLALAGHSHNGQIRLPGIGAIMKVEEGKKYPNEQYEIGNTKLYVSGGLGTSMYEFRLFTRPSINLYRLTTKGTE